jgi:hypothetical protein
MKVVIDQPRARWLPSRYHFATARLIAFVRFLATSAPPQRVDRLVYAIDRDHGTLENYGVSAWIFVTMAAYIASALPLRPAVAGLLSVAISTRAIDFPFFASGLPLSFFGASDNRRANSMFYMTVMLTASVYFAGRPSAVRYVAWFFFAVCAMNAVAAIVMFFLRARIRAMERECGL